VRKQRHESYVHCPVEAALDLIGGKWKAVILFRLMEGTKRFNQLQRLIPHITRRMLTLQLRELEEDKLIFRKVYQQVPPKVEYSLTEAGLTLQPLLIALKDWGETYAPHYLKLTVNNEQNETNT
jgi:DNA-binding HxlR family transcriptional regulator